MMDEDFEGQAFCESGTMRFTPPPDTEGGNHIEAVNTLLRSRASAQRKLAADMYDLKGPLSRAQLTNIRKSKPDFTADQLVKFDTTPDDTAATLASLFAPDMFTTERCDDEMIRLVLTPDDGITPPLHGAISEGVLPNGFHLVNGDQIRTYDSPTVFAMFFVSWVRSRYLGVFCLHYSRSMWVTIDMGEYSTRVRTDYRRHVAKRPIPVDGLGQTCGYHAAPGDILTHIIVCDDADVLSPTPFAALHLREPVARPISLPDTAEVSSSEDDAPPPPLVRQSGRIPAAGHDDVREDPSGSYSLVIRTRKDGRSPMACPFTKQKLTLGEIYGLPMGGKTVGKGGKQCPMPDTKYATVAVVYDGETIVSPLPRDISFKYLLQAAARPGFFDNPTTRVFMYWRIRTPYKFLAAVHADLTEVLNNGCDSFIGPGFMGYLPAVCSTYGIPYGQSVEEPGRNPHIQLADRLWLTIETEPFETDYPTGIEYVVATLLYHHGEHAVYAVGNPTTVPSSCHSIAVSGGHGYLMITVRLGYSIFMHMFTVSFVHYLYSLMTHMPNPGTLASPPSILPSMRESQ
jgi:hypothetical protein